MSAKEINDVVDHLLEVVVFGFFLVMLIRHFFKDGE